MITPASTPLRWMATFPIMSWEKNTPITDNQRAIIAKGWASSGMAQVEYARLHGIKPRTLRDWIQRWAQTTSADVRALAIVQQTLRDLQALHDALAAKVACQQAESQGKPQPTGGIPATCDAELARRPAAPVDLGPVIAERQGLGRGVFEW